MATDSAQSSELSPTIHEATLASGPSGAVEWGELLTFEEAVSQRQQERDIVVRGDDVNANRKRARTVEEAVGSASRPEPPHTTTAGTNALPHFHQKSRSPAGHSFYETAKRKARKRKP
jgi:hypothetical protein